MNLIATCERLRELEQKATPGQWEVLRDEVGDEEYFIVADRIKSGDKLVVSNEGGFAPRDGSWTKADVDANAELTCHMHNAAPDLLEVLGGFQPGDAAFLSALLADYVVWENYNDAPVEGGAEILRRLLVAARQMEADR